MPSANSWQLAEDLRHAEDEVTNAQLVLGMVEEEEGRDGMAYQDARSALTAAQERARAAREALHGAQR